VNVNAYHQPGVEAGKKAAEAVLAVQKKVMGALDANERSAQSIAEAIGVEDAETVFLVLRHLAANERIKRSAGARPGDDRFSR
jgi:glucose-6-phosphate isomerase